MKEPQNWLVVSTNPLETYARQIGFIFPKFRGENNKKIETTTKKTL